MGMVAIALNSHDLLALMGKGFSAGGSALLMLAVAQTAVCYGSNAGFLLVLSGRQTVELVNSIAVALLNLGLGLAWIPGHGALGAASATAVSCIVISALRVIEVKVIMDVSTLRRQHLVSLAAAAVLTLPMARVFQYFRIHEGTGATDLLIRIVAAVCAVGLLVVSASPGRWRRA
jgi:O-antigen/teichoic acid export membrane protein